MIKKDKLKIKSKKEYSLAVETKVLNFKYWKKKLIKEIIKQSLRKLCANELAAVF